MNENLLDQADTYDDLVAALRNSKQWKVATVAKWLWDLLSEMDDTQESIDELREQIVLQGDVIEQIDAENVELREMINLCEPHVPANLKNAIYDVLSGNSDDV